VSLTNILYFTAIHRVGASRAALYTYLEPFLGVLFAVVLLGDRVTFPQLAGGAIIVGAVALGRPRRLAVAEPGM
jgi:drug/metabolite transporter (DMT)-like permease